MSLKEDSLQRDIGTILENIRKIKGVENAVLTQRDGNPIQSCGVWFSKDEIFNVSAASCAVYNTGINLYPNDLKYILIEGAKGKVLITPLKSPIDVNMDLLKMLGILDDKHEFFIAITAQSQINLGGIFLNTGECLREIKKTLLQSDQSFKPPQKEYDQKRIEQILKGFNVKEETESDLNLSSFTYTLTTNIKVELKNTLDDLSSQIHDLKYAFVSTQGGFIISELNNSREDFLKLDAISAMNYSLFEIAKKCAWLLKKAIVNTVLIECENFYSFIYKLNGGVFSAKIGKKGQKLGLLRLIVPSFIQRMEKLIKKIPKFEPPDLRGEISIALKPEF